MVTAGAPAARAQAVRSALLFVGEVLASPAVLIADLFHRERTLTRRTLIAYLVLLAITSSIAWAYLVIYRDQVRAAWTVLDSYEQASQDLPGMPYANEIRLYAAEQGLDPALVAAVIIAESSFRPEAVSRAGARGLMQLRQPRGASSARPPHATGATLHQPAVPTAFSTPGPISGLAPPI